MMGFSGRLVSMGGVPYCAVVASTPCMPTSTGLRRSAETPMPSDNTPSLPFPSRAILAPAGSDWGQWQVGVGTGGTRKPRFLLDKADPHAKPWSLGSKTEDQHAIEAAAVEIDALQNLFWADRRFKLLLVLQGMDASGKDGTVRKVFSRTTPLGVHTISWKAPTEPEQAHDFLWRIHQQVPGSGEIMVFNRSHYEDVLVPVIGGHLTPAQTRQRFAHINDFERLLAETGTVIVKCMLHISRDEQRKRLQERIDNPAKHWKFDHNDLVARQRWDDYQRAYEDLLNATSTPWAPWNVVPSDSKTHRNLMVARLLRDTLRALPLRIPPEDPTLSSLRIP